MVSVVYRGSEPRSNHTKEYKIGTMKIQLSVFVLLKADIISPWNTLQIARFGLNNNHSLQQNTCSIYTALSRLKISSKIQINDVIHEPSILYYF
jgi:hypothetical protein